MKKVIKNVINFLNKKQIPIWLAILIALCSWLIPQYFNNKGVEKLEKQEIRSYLIEYVNDLKTYSYSISDVYKYMGLFSDFMEVNASDEALLRCCEALDNSLIKMNEINMTVISCETKLILQKTRIFEAGYDINILINDPLKKVESSQFSVILPAILEIPLSSRSDVTTVAREDLASAISSLKDIEEYINLRIDLLQIILE